MLAEVMQFYGLSFDAVLDMDSRWFYKFYNRIAVVEARRLLAQLDVVSYPHVMEKSGRQKIVNNLENRAHIAQLRHVASTSAKAQDDGWRRLRQFAGGGGLL